MKIRRGDHVIVICGDDKSEVPRRVTRVLEGGRKLQIEGVNRVHKHVRRGHPRSPQGGRLQIEMPIDSSNCLLYCDACHKGVRAGFRFTDDGAKERYCKSCGGALGTVGAAKTRKNQ